MQEIDSHNAAEYLRQSGRVESGARIEVRDLAGGVSNVVLLVELADRGERFVLKQARGQLRVKEDWRCSVERIWREVETLRICGALLKKRRAGGVSPLRHSGLIAQVPQFLWEDRDNYAYAMTAAPPEHRTWKEQLLAGELAQSREVAVACGEMLAALHAGSWENSDIAAGLEDRSFFDQLRLDPYYRQVGRVHPDFAAEMQRLVDCVWSHRRCLVHGDYSPKNLLVWSDPPSLARRVSVSGQVMLIDFEVGHYGDPAFDLGFFLTHLVLKAIWSGPRRADYLQLAELFWEAYRKELSATIAEDEIVALEARACWNLAGCLLARVDGKSPVDYLTAEQQEEVRTMATAWVRQPPAMLARAVEQVRTEY